MEKFERNGVRFSAFERDGETYLCTGEVTGELKFELAGEFTDYYKIIGATSVVSGKDKTVDELYSDWLKVTDFERNVLGITF